jgi:hypothetical protein
MESSSSKTARVNGGIDASLAVGRGGAWTVGISFGAFALACVFAIDDLTFDLSSRNLLATGRGVAYELGVSHTRLLWIGMAIGATLLASAVGWLVWQCSAHTTIARLGIERTRFTPALGFGGWLLPAANLILPYLAVREIWRASEPEAGASDWRRRRASPFLWAWWIVFVAGVFFAILGVRSELGSHVLNHQLVVRDRLLIVACWAGIITAGLGGIIVKQVNDRLFVRANRASHGFWSGRSRR